MKSIAVQKTETAPGDKLKELLLGNLRPNKVITQSSSSKPLPGNDKLKKLLANHLAKNSKTVKNHTS